MYDRFRNHEDYLKFLVENFIDLRLITFYCFVSAIRAMVSLTSVVLFLIPRDFGAWISFAQKISAIVVHNRLA